MMIQTIETNSSSKLHIDPAENLSSYFLVLKNVTDKRSSTKSYMSGLSFEKIIPQSVVMLLSDE